MNIALLPTLNDGEKVVVKDWLLRVLRSPRLVVASTRYPLVHNKIMVYIDGSSRFLHSGQWSDDGTYIRLGQESTLLEVGTRLGILAAIISVAGLWTELTDEFSTAVSRSLLESYNTAMQGLVRLTGSGPATGLAFNDSRTQCAALVDGVWSLPGGQPVEIDSSWVAVQ